MAKRFDLIVFDWDGTLMDSTGAISRSISRRVRKVPRWSLPVFMCRPSSYSVKTASLLTMSA